MVKSLYLLRFFCLKNLSKKLIYKNKEANSKKQIRENNFLLNAKIFCSRKLIPAKNISFKVYNSLEVDDWLI